MRQAIQSHSTVRSADEWQLRPCRLLTELLIQLSAVAEEARVFVVGATNRPGDLDPALMRRFHRRLQARSSLATSTRILLEIVLFLLFLSIVTARWGVG